MDKEVEKKEVFISYSQDDWPFRNTFIKAFEKNDVVKCWVDFRKIDYGTRWEKVIAKGIRHATCVLLIVSPEAMSSPYVLKELNLAHDLGKQIFTVLVRGRKEDLPPRITSIQWLDLRDAGSEKNNNRIEEMIQEFVVAIENYAKNAPPEASTSKPEEDEKETGLPPATTSTTRSQSLTPPLNYLKMQMLLEELEKAARLVDKVKGRASLLWFDDDSDEIYVVAATNKYEEAELRVRLEKGKGIAGEFRSQPETIAPMYYYVPDYSETYMEKQWGFTADYIKLIRNMQFIICVPIYRNSEMIAILCVDVTNGDSADNSPNLMTKGQFEDSNLSRELRLIGNEIGEVMHDVKHHPLPYFKHVALENLILTARSAPEYKIPVRAGMFWWDEDEQHLYMIGRSQRYSQDWDPAGITWKDWIGLIGEVRAKGQFDVSDRKLPLEGELPKGMNDVQYDTVKDVRSIVAAPIRLKKRELITGENDVVGVLALLSTYPLKKSKLEKTSDILFELAEIAASIYTTPPDSIKQEYKSEDDDDTADTDEDDETT